MCHLAGNAHLDYPDITGSIWFRSNPALVSLSGLPQITELTGDLNLDHFDWQFEPSSLSELDGLENLRIAAQQEK